MDHSQHDSLVRAAREVISEGFKVTHNRLFEWDSDKAREVYDDRGIKFTVVSLMLLTEDRFFRKMGRKFGSEDIGDGQRFYHFYPVTAADTREYG